MRGARGEEWGVEGAKTWDGQGVRSGEIRGWEVTMRLE